MLVSESCLYLLCLMYCIFWLFSKWILFKLESSLKSHVTSKWEYHKDKMAGLSRWNQLILIFFYFNELEMNNTVKPDETGHWVSRNPAHSNLNFKSPVFSLIFFVKIHWINRTLHIPNSGLDLRSQYTNYCYKLSP